MVLMFVKLKNYIVIAWPVKDRHLQFNYFFEIMIFQKQYNFKKNKDENAGVVREKSTVSQEHYSKCTVIILFNIEMWFFQDTLE